MPRDNVETIFTRLSTLLSFIRWLFKLCIIYPGYKFYQKLIYFIELKISIEINNEYFEVCNAFYENYLRYVVYDETSIFFFKKTFTQSSRFIKNRFNKTRRSGNNVFLCDYMCVYRFLNRSL